VIAYVALGQKSLDTLLTNRWDTASVRNSCEKRYSLQTVRYRFVFHYHQLPQR